MEEEMTLAVMHLFWTGPHSIRPSWKKEAASGRKLRSMEGESVPSGLKNISKGLEIRK
jgi:hypothetical protein